MTKPQVAWMIETCETIAVEGGAGAETTPTPAQRYEIHQRIADLLYQAAKRIPRAHRIGWYQALARFAGQPFTEQPTATERAYLAWSNHRRTSPRQHSEHSG